MASRNHQDELKCLYLSGLIDAGYSRAALTHFLEVTKSGNLATWSLDQLRDAGIEFTQTHKTSREVELTRELQGKLDEMKRFQRNWEREVSQAWKQGFLEGCIGENEQESGKLIVKLQEWGITDPVLLKNEELKAFFYAVNRQFDASVMEQISVAYKARLAPKEADSVLESAPSVQNSQGKASFSGEMRYFKRCKRLPVSPFLAKQPIAVQVER